MIKNEIAKQQSDFILYTSNEGKVNIEVFLQDETIWLTQKAISELYGVQRPAITKHLKNIFDSGELQEDSVSSILEHTASDGKKYKTKFYNLDAIISVGYRVNSYQATQFRIWATRTLKEYIIKGFVLDDERLKQGNQVFGRDYFEELLLRIREIRASERRFYQKIIATVQDKLHWAITGKTAAEIIYDSADTTKIHIGSTNWKQAPDGKIMKSDVFIAKNYLNEAHIKELNQIVSAYLDLAENRAQRQILMKMEDWVQFLHGFLELSEYPILKDKGKVSALEAKLKAKQEFEKYRVIQDRNFISDFDREIQRIMGAKGGNK